MNMRQKLLRKYSLYIIGACALLFGILIYLVYFHPISHIDVAFSREFQSEGDSPFEKSLLFNIFRFVSYLGVPAVAAIIVLFSALIFWLFGYFRESVYALVTVIGTPIEYGIKAIINRPRPPEDVVNIIDRQSTSSFPSGHVVFFTIFFGFLIAAMFANKKINPYLRGILVLVSLALIVLASLS